jgi:hypothetical protein
MSEEFHYELADGGEYTVVADGASVVDGSLVFERDAAAVLILAPRVWRTISASDATITRKPPAAPPPSRQAPAAPRLALQAEDIPDTLHR